MFTFKTVNNFVFGIGIGLMVVAAYYCGRTHGINTKFEEMWDHAQDLRRRLEVAEKHGEIFASQARERIEYLENTSLDLQSRVSFYKRQNEMSEENYKQDHDALVRLAEELRRERQLLTLIDDYLKDVDPDALENLRKGVQ